MEVQVNQVVLDCGMLPPVVVAHKVPSMGAKVVDFLKNRAFPFVTEQASRIKSRVTHLHGAVAVVAFVAAVGAYLLHRKKPTENQPQQTVAEQLRDIVPPSTALLPPREWTDAESVAVNEAEERDMHNFHAIFHTEREKVNEAEEHPQPEVEDRGDEEEYSGSRYYREDDSLFDLLDFGFGGRD